MEEKEEGDEEVEKEEVDEEREVEEEEREKGRGKRGRVVEVAKLNLPQSIASRSNETLLHHQQAASGRRQSAGRNRPCWTGESVDRTTCYISRRTPQPHPITVFPLSCDVCADAIQTVAGWRPLWVLLVDKT